MNYLAFKHLHVTCVVLSLSLFVLRGGLQLVGIDWRRWLLLKIAPHIIDTVLLASAVALAMLLHQYPFVHGWLTAKLLGLLAYIAFGKLALKRGNTRGKTALALSLALLSAAYIVGVALTRSPAWGF